ncbi:MAG: hypothetical protein HS114_19280 [Anaerolineales bacterium]|nr:hypothetical protein [Anaerolineales bacterium]
MKENNPKAYVLEGDRLDKTRQPKGDRDCSAAKAQCLLREAKVETTPAQPAPRPKGQSRDLLLLQRCLLLGLRLGVVYESPTGASSSWLN